MLDDINAQKISRLHDECLARPDTGGPGTGSGEGLWHFIAANHRYNSLLWDEEDQARRLDVPDSVIAANKRAIDRYNQLRNNAIEAMDEIILDALGEIPLAEGVWLNSETAGSMIDRLSITALKIHHMRLQTLRSDATAEHRKSCQSKLERLITQRRDLQFCLDTLLAGMRAGRCTYRVYRQFKMYNDPALNPYLYGAGTPARQQRHG